MLLDCNRMCIDSAIPPLGMPSASLGVAYATSRSRMRCIDVAEAFFSFSRCALGGGVVVVAALRRWANTNDDPLYSIVLVHRVRCRREMLFDTSYSSFLLLQVP
jgi:hypothetical protein